MAAAEFEVQFAFPRRFEVRPGQLPASPGRRVFYYPGARNRGGKDGPILEVVPNDSPSWIGVFASGRYGPSALARWLLGWPDCNSFCVVADGAGYVVRADEPTRWLEVGLYPITDVRVALDEKLVVFADFTRLIAYSADGLVWVTPRLSWDGVWISEVAGGEVLGFGWDAAHEQKVAFRVDARTGESSGGASPD